MKIDVSSDLTIVASSPLVTSAYWMCERYGGTSVPGSITTGKIFFFRLMAISSSRRQYSDASETGETR